MHKSSKNYLTKVVQILFLCLFFFSACTKKKNSIGVKDRNEIQSFLNEFLFVHSSAYTLFGEKPITEMFIFTGTRADLMELTEEEMKSAMPLDESIVEKWRTWKHYTDKMPSKHFILTERLCPYDPAHTIYSILNVKQVKKILDKYREFFETQIGASFDPDKVISEFKNPQSLFWEKVFKDHFLSGLLFGYGEENATYFLDHIKTEEGESRFSDVYNPSATVNNFPIPIFAISPNDSTANSYRKQKTKIQELFRDKDIVDTTLERLMK